ncbi:MAG: response regulator [Pirellulales bacterium]
MRREGLETLKARSGSEALEYLLRYNIALALVDVQMPEMDGFELAELMRTSDRTHRIPIIFVTAGNADRQRRFRGYEAGAVDFLQKPIEPDILRGKAAVFFELYRQRQEVATQRDELIAKTAENQRLLQESRNYSDELKLADRRKDEFLAMLAHELRNPLAPIKNAVELLRLLKPADDGTTGEACAIITRQVDHMTRLVDDLLDTARIAQGKVRLRIERCDLAQVVRRTAEDYRDVLAQAGLTLTLNASSTPLWVEGDAARLAQVVGNLLHNACKFTPAGGVVSVTAHGEGSHGAIEVRDTGAGMTAEFIRRVFEPFSQADQTMDRSGGGLGLGLALVKGLIEQHGGAVAAESAGPGLGSAIRFHVPLAAVPTPAPTISPSECSTSNGLRIVVVEDNPDSAQTLRMLLKLLGHQVEVAFDGRSALDVCATFRPQVVISDLGLPGELNGFGVAKHLKSTTDRPTPYLIALSGYTQDQRAGDLSEMVFDLHLLKPVDLKRLKEVLSQVMIRA